MLRLGIVDFDSSHSIEFTQRFNRCGVDADQFVEGARVVAGCPGTSVLSPERVPGFTARIAACGVDIVERPEDLLGRIDAVLVLSVCGTPHLERVRPFLEAGIPAYVDKPLAGTLADANEIRRLADEKGLTVFSSSSLRFSHDLVEFDQRRKELGRVSGVLSWGPAKRHPLNPGLLHYGIHAVEVLFTLLGTGCVRVSTTFADDSEIVTGLWSDGRTGIVRGTRAGCTAYGALAFCEAGVVPIAVSSRYSYRNLCRAIVESFETGQPAVPLDTTLEIIRFVAAALESERNDGRPVALSDVG